MSSTADIFQEEWRIGEDFTALHLPFPLTPHVGHIKGIKYQRERERQRAEGVGVVLGANTGGQVSTL